MGGGILVGVLGALGPLLASWMFIAGGLLMVFSPEFAERLRQKSPFNRISGQRIVLWGWVTLVIGILGLVLWLSEHLSIPR
jgi:hypothetical protein